MEYELALKHWGARRLEAMYRKPIDQDSVTVQLSFKEGFACCGENKNPDCHCSFAQEPSAEILVTGLDKEPINKKAKPGNRLYTLRSERISHDEFDFVEFLGEIVEAGGGTVT